MRRWALILATCLTVGCSPPAQETAPITCLDLDSGTTLWLSLRGRNPHVGPSVACVEVGGDLVGVDLRSGRELWKIAVPKGRLFLQGDLLMAYEGAVLTAWDARNPATTRWTATILQGMTPVAVADGIVVVRGKNGLSALDATTGRQLWSHSGDYSVAAVAGGKVFAGLAGGSAVEAHDLARGERLWSSNVGDTVWSLTPDRTVVVRTRATVEGLAMADGRPLWKLAEPDANVDVGGAGEGLFALVGPDSARVLSAEDGKPVATIGASLARRVVMVDGRVFSLTGNPGGYQLKGFDARSGQQAWARNSAGSGGNFPVSAAGRLIVPFEVRP